MALAVLGWGWFMMAMRVALIHVFWLSRVFFTLLVMLILSAAVPIWLRRKGKLTSALITSVISLVIFILFFCAFVRS
jgi:hypothetical protein